MDWAVEAEPDPDAAGSRWGWTRRGLRLAVSYGAAWRANRLNPGVPWVGRRLGASTHLDQEVKELEGERLGDVESDDKVLVGVRGQFAR